MAIGKITGSVVADNTLTESNLAFGISGQSSATSWATDTLKVNIIESDDSTAIQLNDALNVSGELTLGGNINLSDNAKIQLGASQDLEIYHDGSNSFVDDTGTGNLYIRSNAIRIQKYTNENMITADADLGVGLYYDNALTFQTISGGAEVTGDLKVDSISANDSSVVSFNSPIHVDTISSSDSTAIQINDAVNISGTVSADTIDTNLLQSGDSTNIRVADNLVPASDNTYSLGTADRKWSALYVTGSTIFLDTTKLQVDGSGDFTVKDAGNNLKRVVASEIEIGTGSNKIKMQRGANGKVKFTDENDIPTPVLQIVGDDSTGVSLNTNETVKIAGTQNITTAVSGDTLTITGPDLSSYITAASTATLTNKTFDANGTGNSITNIEFGDFASGEILDEDDMSSNSATKLATQQSIKAYVDSVAGGTLSLGDTASNSGSVDVNGGDNLEFRAGNSITPTVAGNGVTIALNDAIVVNAISSSDSSTVRINDSIETENAQINTNLTVDGNAQVKGNLTVQGTTTYIETTNTKISDPLLLLSNGNSGGSDIDAGIMIERGSAGNNAVFYWNEGDDKFKAVTTTSGEDATAITDSATATIVANIEGNVTGTVSDVSNHDTDDIAEGSSNLYYTNTRFDTQLATKDTGDLTEGSNLYYTDARARASVSVTDAGGDGSLSYNSSTGVITYTGPSAAEVRAHISGGTGVTISSGEIAIGQSVATTADVTFNSVVTNAISSSDSSAVQINDGVNISGTLSVNSIDVNSLTSSDSSGINIDEAKLYVNGASVLTAGSGGDVERTTSTAQVTDVLINNSGTVFRIPLANIDISSFNNDAGFASGGVSGFSASTVTSFPVELGDSAARDYGDGEQNGVGTGTAENTDAFGVALGTTFDCMEPIGSTLTTDLGSEEAHVGA